jgi:tetratricopeptide (TPR) repeat protein
VQLWRRTGDRRGLARALDRLALAALEEGAHEEARTLLEESLALFRSVGDRRSMGRALDRLGQAAYTSGDLTTARIRYEESIALHRADGDDQIAGPLCNLAWLYLDLGNVTAARARGRECLAVQRASMARVAIERSLDLMAGVAAAEGYPERALRLASASATLRKAMGMTLTPQAQAKLRRQLDALRLVLAADACAQAWAAGQAMSLEQAVAYALEEASGDG